jgi:hypothetical protein
LERCLKLYDQAMREKVQKGLLEHVQPETKEPEKMEKGKKPPTKRNSKATKEKNQTSQRETPQDLIKQVPLFQQRDIKNLTDFQKWFEDAPEEFLEALITHLSSTLVQVKEEASR